MRYEGYYATFENPIKGTSLSELISIIESAAGYENLRSDFREYETAYISEYNSIERQTAKYYFSMRDKKWHRSENSLKEYRSWESAKEPYKTIAQWLLDKLGYKKVQEERWNKFAKEL
jgi:hypothetical protein